MNYKTAVQKFLTKYNIASLVKGSNQIKLDEKTAFMLVSESYAKFANRHKLIQKYSTDNSTPQTNLVAGQTTYTSGTTATTIPSDILDIYAVTLNDTNKSPLDRLNITSLQGVVRGSGTPTGYAIDKTTKILELDASPTESFASNSAMRLIIHYTAKIQPYMGAGDTGSFSDLDFTSSTYGGSFLTPVHWDDLIIIDALGELIPEKKSEALLLEQQILSTNPSFYNYELPYYNGTYEDFLDDETPGLDSGRGG